MGPTLLIASPQMTDPFFERTVVLLWHHDDDGAIGVVVNRKLPQQVRDVLPVDRIAPGAAPPEGHVRWGGPVDTDSGTVITSASVEPEEGWALECGLGVTRSQDALRRLLLDNAPMLLCVGYAGWGPGQLDQEVHAGGWLYTDVDPGLVLGAPEGAWERALATLGLTPTTVWMQPIDE